MHSSTWSFQRIIRASISALLLAAFFSTVQAQQPRTDGSPQTNPPGALGGVEKSAPSVFVPPEETNRILPGDTLNVVIDDAPELSKLYRVSAGGTILMPPPLGQVNAKQLTTEKLARHLAAVLLQEDYLKKPQVNISIAQYYADSYFVQGAVRAPGVFLVRHRPSLLGLITLAGGLADNSGTTAIILRPVKAKPAPEENAKEAGDANLRADVQDPPKEDAPQQDLAEGRDDYELIRLNLSNMMDRGRFEQNFKIEPGDIVHIPVANVFYVAGEVVAPGSFKLKEGTTLRQAISLAQGTTYKARLGDAVIFRDDTRTGQRQEIKVDVAAVMSGKKEDIPIHANDIIIVPHSRMKSVGGSLLMALGANSARIR